jgi:hypothetical protein
LHRLQLLCIAAVAEVFDDKIERGFSVFFWPFLPVGGGQHAY